MNDLLVGKRISLKTDASKKGTVLAIGGAVGTVQGAKVVLVVAWDQPAGHDLELNNVFAEMVRILAVQAAS